MQGANGDMDMFVVAFTDEPDVATGGASGPTIMAFEADERAPLLGMLVEHAPAATPRPELIQDSWM
jgi:hypothetical protein